MKKKLQTLSDTKIFKAIVVAMLIITIGVYAPLVSLATWAYSDYGYAQQVRARMKNNFNTDKKGIATIISQGDGIQTLREKSREVVDHQEGETTYKVSKYSSYCTAGYIDPVYRVMYSARHCFDRVGDEVMDSRGKRLGVVMHMHGKTPSGGSRLFYPSRLPEDFAIVALYNDVIVRQSANGYSTDRIAKEEDIQRGEKLCRYGNRTNTVECGTILYYNGTTVVSTMQMSNRGDSGGPVWIPDKGFVGVHSRSTNSTDQWWMPSKSITFTSRIKDQWH